MTQTLQWNKSKSFAQNLSIAVRLAVLNQTDCQFQSPEGNSYVAHADGQWEELQPTTPMKQ